MRQVIEVVLLYLLNLFIYCRHAEAIKLLDVVINSDKALAPRDIYDFKVECASALGWHHWARNEKMHIDINFPKRYSLF